MTSNTHIDLASNPKAATANRRIFRLAFGTSLSLVFSQIVNWDMSFIAAVFTMFLLATPMPAPTLGKAIGLFVGLLLPICLGIAVIPLLNGARWAGIIIVACALYYSFYYSAKGGSALIGTFFTFGLTMVVTVGSLSLDILLMLIEDLALGVVFGLVFVWIAYAVFPDLPPPPRLQPQAIAPARKPNLPEARRAAFRSMLIAFPVTLILLFSSNSAAYIVVMMKVSAMGQQATTDHSRAMGRSLLESTFWGGLGAILAWQWLSIWPNLTIYALIIAIAALLYGSRIYSGYGMSAKGNMWMNAFLTMIVVLAPAVIDSQGGSSAGAAFYSRLILVSVAAVYGTVAVAVFNAFWMQGKKKKEERKEGDTNNLTT
jgi:hypothetical protein